MAYPSADGVGFVFKDEHGIVGIDLDHCIDDDGNVSEQATEIVKKIGSYAEVSMSGHGLHIFVRGKKPDRRCKGDGVELYHSGRSFVTTGNVLPGYERLVENQPGLDWLYRKYVKKKAKESPGCVKERARAYIMKMPDSIDGQGGDQQLFLVAEKLVRGFDLSDDDAMDLLEEYNSTKCFGPWDEHRLAYKINEAREDGEHDYGYMLKDDEEDDEDLCKNIIPITDSIEKYFSELQSGAYIRMSTGLPVLDHALKGGIRKGEMVVVAGRPSHGKTALVLHILESLARQGRQILMMSIEMPTSVIGQRLSQRYLGCESTSQSAASDKQASSCWDVRHLDNVKLADKVSNIDYLIRQAKRCRELYGTDTLMVDYLQIVGADARDEYSRTVDVSRKLALLKREGFTVVAAAQLNRSVEDRDDFAPRMSDFKSSGQIEQDTDIALSCVYDDMVEGKPKFQRREDTNFRIHIHKSRQSGFLRPVVYCVFDAASQQFADSYEPEPEVFHEFDDYSPTQQVLGIDEEV